MLDAIDDVTLARHMARNGARVGFLDGAKIIGVRAYSGIGQMWREWGRSFDLKDATPMRRRWLDVALVWSAQALPLPLLVGLGLVYVRNPSLQQSSSVSLLEALLLVNASALFVRLMLLAALRGSYAERGAPFWFSWLADVAAAWRLTLSTARVPKSWRGRQYDTFAADQAG
jgi:dolichol-phosphate mannosyltransferase